MYAGNTEILAGNSIVKKFLIFLKISLGIQSRSEIWPELAQTYRVQILTFHIKPRCACLFPLKVKQKCMYRKHHQTENDQLLIN
jgi:hypothetical protein